MNPTENPMKLEPEGRGGALMGSPRRKASWGKVGGIRAENDLDFR